MMSSLFIWGAAEVQLAMGILMTQMMRENADSQQERNKQTRWICLQLFYK
jgi:hypothetical protein